MDALSDIKILLGIAGEDESKDALLSLALLRSEETIKNYCRIDEVPDELYQTYKSGYGSETADGVKQVREGDVTITFSSESQSAALGGGLFGFAAQLDRFRKVGWQ